MRDPERLITRIRQIRAASIPADHVTEPLGAVGEGDQLDALEARVRHLEALVQGFQDSVHREPSRYAIRIAELEARIRPDVLSKALSDDARARGL